MKKIGSWMTSIALAGLATCMAPAQAADLVTNGGFEAGSFANWMETGESAFNGVQCAGPGAAVYAGNCSAFFGPFSEIGGISQVIDLGAAGTPWELSFALQSDGGTPSSFAVTFGGQTLLSLTDPLASDFTLYHFSGVSTEANMALAFNFLDQQGYLSLDAVSVTAVPEPSTIALMGAGLAGLFFWRRRKPA